MYFVIGASIHLYYGFRGIEDTSVIATIHRRDRRGTGRILHRMTFVLAGRKSPLFSNRGTNNGWNHPVGGFVMLLKDKVAVIYGAGGAVGSVVAAAFAKEGEESFYLVAQPPMLRRSREGLRRTAELRKPLR